MIYLIEMNVDFFLEKVGTDKTNLWAMQYKQGILPES